MIRSLAALLVLAPGILPRGAIGDDPPRPVARARARVEALRREGKPLPSIRVRLVHPDAQLGELIGLFRGSRAAHPAAALAAWKRASAEPNRLGKPLEAAIAAFNPTMIPELRTLDDAGLAIRFEVEGARPTWRAFLPRDDGTFAALASAFVLTDGESETPLGEVPVDRLGRPGSPLMARGPGIVLIAPDRAGLALARVDAMRGPMPTRSDGVSLLIESGALWGLSESKSLTARRIGEAFDGSQAPPLIEASASLGGSTLSASLLATFDRAVATRAAVDPSWLDWIPRDRASAAFALAVEPGEAGWASAFALLDRVEHADPDRVGVAPSRLRLALAARAVGVRVEADLIPRLKGLSGWVDLPGAGLLALHLDDPAAAARVVEQSRPPDVARKRPGFSLTRDGPSVLIAWGEDALEDSRRARAAPDRSGWAAEGPPAAFLASIWPGRVPGLAPVGSPLASALLEARPITWRGTGGEPNEWKVEGRWPGLDGVVRRFLDRIPLDPPPDR